MAEYRPIPNHPGYYAGDDGTIWSSWVRATNAEGRWKIDPEKPWTRLFQYVGRHDYRRVKLGRGDDRKMYYVHRLVLEAFTGPCPEGAEACHYPDADNSNNRLSNLRWDTHKENMKDRWRDRREITTKTCNHCGAVKPVGDFYTCSKATDGYRSLCGDCHCGKAKHTRRLAKQERISEGIYPGETHHSAKLTGVKVMEIRRRRAQGERGVDLAKEFGVSYGTLKKIIARKIWKQVP